MRVPQPIQYLLGHASVVTTERYIHHTLAEPEAAAVLEGGGVFDPAMEPTVGNPIPPIPHRAEPKEGVH